MPLFHLKSRFIYQRFAPAIQRYAAITHNIIQKVGGGNTKRNWAKLRLLFTAKIFKRQPLTFLQDDAQIALRQGAVGEGHVFDLVPRL